jgi:hypothetical protein
MLPVPEQTWSHSTCSVKELQYALNDSNITAIESDIVMGSVIACDASKEGSSQTHIQQPIMAHPPNTTSDLSFRHFMKLAMNDKQELQKHLKLDFKQAECVPAGLDILRENQKAKNNSTNIIYFNADILPGPGVRGAVSISADLFVETCLEFIEETGTANLSAFSLGWKTDPRSLFGYNAKDANAMKELIQYYELSKKCRGVVLAVNARVLAKNVGALDELLQTIPSCQLLIWTGTGEPAISMRLFNYLRRHFELTGCKDRVGFDCQVSLQ